MNRSEDLAAGVRGRWITEAIGLLEFVQGTQMEAIGSAAEICANAIGSGGLVHLFGTGHSRIPVEEMFPRYGSYTGFNPIVDLCLNVVSLFTGVYVQRQSMFLEGVEGVAD